MANHVVDATAHARAASADLSPETQGLHTAGALRARACRYRLLSETLVSPIVIEVVQACARELDAQAASIEMTDVS